MRGSRAAEESKERRERTRLGVPSRKLNLDADTDRRLKADDKVPRWINDSGNRISDALSAGYEFVEHGRFAVKSGDDKESHEVDRRISKLVGTQKDGSPLVAYLMAIPSKYYEEDQEEKEKINRRVDDAIRGGKPPGLQEHGVDPNKGMTLVKNVNYQP